MTTGDLPVNWELGDKPGDCVVTLGQGRVLLGIRVGGPDNAVVMGVERATRVASALLEAAGLAGQIEQVPHGGDLLSVKADLASVRAVLRAVAKDGTAVRLGPEVVRALVTVLDGGQ